MTKFIAFRYFSAKKNEKFVSFISAISLIGITIGVAALIVVMSVMNGFHIELTRNIIGLNGDINITPIGKVINKHPEILKKLSTHAEFTKITQVVTGQALALGSISNSGVLVKGIDLADLKNKGEILENVFEGTFTDYVENNAVAIGFELAHQLGISVGSKIKMIAPNMISTAFGSMPRAKDFTVVAIFSSGLFDYDAATVLMPRQAAQKFLSFDDGINLIELNIKDSDAATEIAKNLQKELGFDVQVTSWRNLNQSFLSALEIERVAMFTILSLIIIVAAFNIVSSLFMTVKDKTKDIAILRTIGAAQKQIMLIFMINGMIIGMIGTVLGISLGLVFSLNIEKIRQFLEKLSGVKIFDPALYFLYNLPSVVRFNDVLVISVLSVVLCFIATLYPAYKASRLNPVEAMRYE